MVRQGLDFVLLRDAGVFGTSAGVPDMDAPGAALPSHTVTLLIQELAAAMVPSVAALVGDAETLAGKQQALALACLYACGRTTLELDSPARTQLGLLADVVSDEHRFPWWRALPLQVALNVTGEGNGGFRTLYGNLAHPNERVRAHMLPIAWIARRRLDAATLASAVLPNVAATDHWATSLAVLRGCCPTAARFRELIQAGPVPADGADQYRDRLAAATTADTEAARYIAAPGDLFRIEQTVRDEVVRVATTPRELTLDLEP
ncbi:MAG TPA: hypothetical protein VGT61_07505 [Thermomicrobiales bacterium]|nr:hypothetical protein [Thermomicrobiales bacterium]